MTRRRPLLIIATASTFLLGIRPIAAQEPKPSAEAVEFFEKSVRPVLADQCLKCHGPQKQKGGLRLDSRATALSGGDSGPAIVPGKPDESLLLTALRQQ